MGWRPAGGLIAAVAACCSLLAVRRCGASLDLFISRQEMNRTLGTSSRVQYVSAGAPSHYAIAFPYLVNANVSYVNFSWRNAGAHTMRYWMKCTSDDPTAVLASVGVPLTGTVPRRLSQFTLFLQCTGVKLGEFRARLQLNYTVGQQGANAAVTAVTLVRRKICAQPNTGPVLMEQSDTMGQSLSLPDYLSDAQSANLQSGDAASGNYAPSHSHFAMDASHVFYISMGGVSAFVLLVACIIIVYFAKAKKFDENGNHYGCRGGVETQVPLCRPTSAVSSHKYASVACAANTSLNTGQRRAAANSNSDSAHNRRLLPAATANNYVAGSPAMGRARMLRFDGGGGSGPNNCDESLLAVDRYGNVAVLQNLDNCSSVYSAVRSSAPPLQPCCDGPRPSPAPSNATTLYFTVEPKPVDCERVLAELEVEQALDACDQWVELQGTFGEMRFCVRRPQQSSAGGDPSLLMAKSLKPHASHVHRENYLREAFALHGLPPHENVSAVTAVYWADRLPVLIYAADCSYGNLKHFLHRSSGRPIESQLTPSSPANPTVGGGDEDDGGRFARRPLRRVASPALAAQRLVKIGADLASGLLHLHRCRILHRDVAARNAVVSASCAARLCDASLSRDLFPADYDCLGDNDNRPLRWMPPEVISAQLRDYSTASDVWSLGVALWELATLGAQPYSDLEADEIEPALNDGLRLPHPYNCPDEFYGVMFCCWAGRPASRPSAEQLLAALGNFHTHLAAFV